MTEPIQIIDSSSPFQTMEDKHLKMNAREIFSKTVKIKVKKNPKKHKMEWFEGKKAHNELVGSGFRRPTNENELFYVDQDVQITKILAKDRQRKGYGMRGDGNTDQDGKVPLILTTENLFNQYEQHKSKIKDLPLFKYSQSKIILRNNLKLVKSGQVDTEEFQQSQELNKKYEQFKQISQMSSDMVRMARLKKFQIQRSTMHLPGYESGETVSTVGGGSLTLHGKRNTKSTSISKRVTTLPTTKEILNVERDEEFDKFYRRIKNSFIDTIDVKKEMDMFVSNKQKKRRELIGRNLIAAKSTKSLDQRRKMEESPEVHRISHEISSFLQESPSLRKSLNSLDNSIDKQYDQLENSVKSILRYNEWKQYEPRKLSIQRSKDKVDLLGYMLVDLKRPYRKKNFNIDGIEFPMTTKFKGKRVNANYERPPLPPDPKKFEKPSRYAELKDRIEKACTVYDTQNKVKF